MAETKIEWTDRTWNPTRGCSRVSPGCDNCYAMRQAHRFSSGPRNGKTQPYEGLTTIRRGKVDWTGSVRLIEDQLEAPLRWRKARRIFVNSMSDLFHESLGDAAIDQVLEVMGACDDAGRGHVFQVLTKRADRARAYLTSERARRAWNSRRMNRSAWPARNLWLGVSAEDQPRAEERIPELLATPAAVRFVSAEPLLGPIVLHHAWLDPLGLYAHGGIAGATLDWVIVGGESGNGARPCELGWVRALVSQCRVAGIAAFVKQLGAHPFEAVPHLAGGHGGYIDLTPKRVPPGWTLVRTKTEAMLTRALRLRDRKGGNMDEWPEELRVREWPARMISVTS